MNDPTEILLNEFRAFRDSEFREFRDDITSWKQETGERVAALEIKATNCSETNSSLEKRVTNIEKIRWKTAGILTALWGGVTLVLTVIAHYLPRGGKH